MARRYRVTFEPGARRDLVGIAKFTAQSSGFRSRGRNVAQSIRRACLKLDMFPHRGTLRPDLGDAIRVIGCQRIATIVFEVDDTDAAVRIIVVLYGGRDVAAVLGRRLKP